MRGDGSTGQLENISLGVGQNGFEYTGKVEVYTYEDEIEVECPYQLIFSGHDDNGVMHIF